MENLVRLRGSRCGHDGSAVRRVGDHQHGVHPAETRFAAEHFEDATSTGMPPALKPTKDALTVLFGDLAFTLGKDEHKSRQPESPSAVWKRVSRHQQKRDQK